MAKKRAVTGWISMTTPPLKDRPGWYDLCFQSGYVERVRFCWRLGWVKERWLLQFAVGWRGLAVDPMEKP